MLKSNQLKFQRGAAAKTEGEDRNNGAENRRHTVTVRLARENLQCFSALWRFEQGQVHWLLLAQHIWQGAPERRKKWRQQARGTTVQQRSESTPWQGMPNDTRPLPDHQSEMLGL